MYCVSAAIFASKLPPTICPDAGSVLLLAQHLRLLV